MKCTVQSSSWSLPKAGTLKVKRGLCTFIKRTMLKVRQKVGMINSVQISGSSFPWFRNALFLSYVLPRFMWLFLLVPIFTDQQQRKLNKFYLICLKGVLRGLHWQNNLFSDMYNELLLDDRCLKYWNKNLLALSNSIDRKVILEQANLNVFREAWLRKETSISGIFRSKRYINHTSLLAKCLSWCEGVASNESFINYDLEEIITFVNIPDTSLVNLLLRYSYLSFPSSSYFSFSLVFFLSCLSLYFSHFLFLYLFFVLWGPRDRSSCK